MSERPPYAEAAHRLLLLVGAKGMSKYRLMDEAGIPRQRLVHYENGDHVPGDAFRKNSEFEKIAEAFSLSPSALIAWWATGDDALLPVYLTRQMTEFEALKPDEKMKRLQRLGWLMPKGRPRKSAVPSAGE